MGIEQAWLLKGWLLSQSPPKEVSEAIDTVIEFMRKPEPELRQVITGPTTIHDMLANSGIPVTPEIHIEEPVAKKPRAPWSEERKAKQAEVMRATQARLKGAKGGTATDDDLAEESPQPTKSYSPVPAEKLISDHNGYAGKRDPDQPLLESDWPDIKHMLNVKRMTVSQVASDYDVEFGTLRSFIDKHEALEEQHLGEAQAPSEAGA